MKKEHTYCEPKDIVCSPKNYDMLAARYPKRKIYFSPFCGDDFFIVFRAGGGIITVLFPEFKIEK